MSEIKLKKTRIHTNALVENAEVYFSEKTQPLKAEIVDASFVRNGEDEYVIEGLWKFYSTRNDYKPDTPEQRHIEKKYSNIALRLFVKEENSGRYSWIRLESLDEIMAHLLENGKEELDELAKSSKKMRQEEIIYEKERLYGKRDSCLPLIHRNIYVYRQSVNGQEVIGFSKYNPEIKINADTK